MKIKRVKKVQKYMSFYKVNFGFREPYQLLIDGTFCKASLDIKASIREQMPKYFMAEVKILTTPCAVIETEKLGPALYGVAHILKQFPIHHCPHKNSPLPAVRCLRSMVGRNNRHRYIIGSQDSELFEQIQQVQGAPFLRFCHGAPTLEKPSQVSMRRVDREVKSSLDIHDQQKKVISHMKAEYGIPVSETATKKRKKKVRGPNPLSCKKKKKKPEIQITASEGGNEKRRRHRKRIKIAKHIKEHWRNQTQGENQQM